MLSQPYLNIYDALSLW